MVSFRSAAFLNPENCFTAFPQKNSSVFLSLKFLIILLKFMGYGKGKT